MDELHADLARIEAELKSAELEYTRLGARINGLKAERDAIAEQAAPPTALAKRIAGKTKAEAIHMALRMSTEPMTLGQIAEVVTAAGNKLKPDGASVYIDGLLKQGRVVRVARGLYRDA
ncbi:hypothetical protein AB0O68_15565 [Streptomyces sp. NPDC087512]|uniref:hypothetical protein n=1 Tax=Streptomyces sp. NPDC087512 TaxID=3155059 RepID=UPI003415CE9E